VGVCVRAVSCGMAWIFIFSGGSVLYWSVGVCPSPGLRKGGFMAGGSLRGCQRLRWGIWYVRRLGDCWL